MLPLVPPSEALRINYVYLKTSGSPLWGTTVPSQRVRSKRVPHSLGTVSTESAARRYYKAIVEFESTLQGHEACDLTVSPYRVYPFPPLVYDGSIAYPRWEPNDRNRVRSLGSQRGSPKKRVEHSKFLWNFGSYCSGTLVPIGQHICPIGCLGHPIG